MKRLFFIKLHLYLAGVALMFMALMSFSGAFHLLIGDESETLTELKTITSEQHLNKEQLSALFAAELKALAPQYRYDQIKGSDLALLTRPTTRLYYSLEKKENKLVFSKHQPSILKRLIEFHQGHGPKSARPVQGLLGVIVFSALASGFWLGISSPALRKTTLISAASGASLIALLFFL